MFRIAIVEDDALYARMLRYVLEQDPGHEVLVYGKAGQCLNELDKAPHLLLTDYLLPDMTGGELMLKIRQRWPATEVLIMSGQEEVRTALQLMREGAYDYILKDDDAKERLLATVQHIKREQRLKQENQTLKTALHTTMGPAMVGQSPAMKRVQQLMDKAAMVDISVMITGETGTGKEVAARLIHDNGLRRNGPFVALNLAAMPESLVESELFGHEKGAFTGANARRAGKMEQAHGGTLFLDEVAEMPLSLQAKLLRVLQERTFARLGGNQELKVDVRLITATHQNLAEMVQQGRFREDLYYRLLGLQLELPPLRMRGQDVLLLAEHFLAHNPHVQNLKLSPQAAKLLLSHPWPGNVRELRAVMELAAVLAQPPTVQPADLQLHTLGAPRPGTSQHFLDPECSMEDYELRIVAHFMQKYDYNVLKVAEVLKVGKSTLYRMLSTHPELRGPVN